jgi:hypothetical protein
MLRKSHIAKLLSSELSYRNESLCVDIAKLSDATYSFAGSTAQLLALYVCDYL